MDPAPISTVVMTADELISKMFPNLQHHYLTHKWPCEKAILAPKNVTVNSINWQLLQALPGNSHTYKSIDTVVDQEEIVHYPAEF